jgi:hypothetical protein
VGNITPVGDITRVGDITPGINITPVGNITPMGTKFLRTATSVKNSQEFNRHIPQFAGFSKLL